MGALVAAALSAAGCGGGGNGKDAGGETPIDAGGGDVDAADAGGEAPPDGEEAAADEPAGPEERAEEGTAPDAPVEGEEADGTEADAGAEDAADAGGEESSCGNGAPDPGEECDGDPPASCVTGCLSTGRTECVGCAWDECVPPAETCNGVDDDCDTVCDNGQECCRGSAAAPCVTGGGLPGTGPCSEACLMVSCCADHEFCANGFDDDCDHRIDELGPSGADARVTEDAGSSRSPAVAFTGSRYQVVWSDDRGGGATDIWGAQLSAAGVEVVAGARISDADAFDSEEPSVAFAGSQLAVAWSDARHVESGDGNTEIYLARLDAAGAKIGADLRVTSAAAASRSPAVAVAGGDYALAWQDERDGNSEVYYARVTTAGAKAGADARVTSDAGWSETPVIACAPAACGVAWSDDRTGNSEIFFALLAPDGTKTAGDVRLSVGTGPSRFPSIAWSGTEYGVAWDDMRDLDAEIYFARVSAAGAPVGSERRVTSHAGDSWYASVVYGNGEYAVAWEDEWYGTRETYFVLLSAAGVPWGGGLELTAATVYTGRPALVYDGTGWAAAVESARDGNDEIYLLRLACGP